MNIKQAWAIVGNQPQWAIRSMIKALSIGAFRNTPEENERLEAARICAGTTNPRYA